MRRFLIFLLFVIPLVSACTPGVDRCVKEMYQVCGTDGIWDNYGYVEGKCVSNEGGNNAGLYEVCDDLGYYSVGNGVCCPSGHVYVGNNQCCPEQYPQISADGTKCFLPGTDPNAECVNNADCGYNAELIGYGITQICQDNKCVPSGCKASVDGVTLQPSTTPTSGCNGFLYWECSQPERIIIFADYVPGRCGVLESSDSQDSILLDSPEIPDINGVVTDFHYGISSFFQSILIWLKNFFNDLGLGSFAVDYTSPSEARI